MSNEKKPHKHAKMIAEWVKDTSRKVECQEQPSGIWHPCYSPRWHESREYRFAKEEPKIKSSLTYNDIYKVLADVDLDDPRERCRVIANAAAQRAIEDLRCPSYGWLDNEILKLLPKYDIAGDGATITYKIIAAYLLAKREGEET